MRKSNSQIVLRYLEEFDGRGTVRFPDGFEYGISEGKLCLIFMFSEHVDGEWIDGDESWTVYAGSFNYFIEQCELLTEEEIMGMVFALGTKKEIERGSRHTNISG